MRALVGLLLLLLSVLPSRAAEPPAAPWPDPPSREEWRRAEELARRGLDTLRRSLESLMNAVPQYGVPYVDPDGNIVVPRRAAPPAAPAPGTPVPEDRPLRT